MTKAAITAELARRQPHEQPSAGAVRRLARRRFLVIELVRGTLGLATVGALGGVLGGWLLSNTVQPSGPYAAAFQAGMGSLLVAGTAFAILGALGHVVFGDVVGDFRTEPRGESTSREDHYAEVAIEFVGGGTWGIVCGMLVGVVGGAAGSLLGLVFGPIQTGAAGGALLGFVLSVLAAVFRSLRDKQRTRIAFTLRPFSSSTRPSDEQITRRP